jgi:hypothetical protein
LFFAVECPADPMQRMGVGMLFCAFGFLLSGFVQVGIDRSAVAPTAPSSASMVRFWK